MHSLLVQVAAVPAALLGHAQQQQQQRLLRYLVCQRVQHRVKQRQR